jgi:hypothetical protein
MYVCTYEMSILIRDVLVMYLIYHLSITILTTCEMKSFSGWRKKVKSHFEVGANPPQIHAIISPPATKVSKYSQANL